MCVTEEPLPDVLSPNIHEYAAWPEHDDTDEEPANPWGLPTVPVGDTSAEHVNTQAGEEALIVFVEKCAPPAFDTSNATEYDAALLYRWVGFCNVLVAPSPKFHPHDVGAPVEVSVNRTTSPGFGDEGDHVKFATGAAGAVEIVLTR